MPTVNAQEHPFLSSFTVQEGFGNVILEWTMISGNTCFGIQIFRSLDGVEFSQVGQIDGLCGNISEAVDYQFIDEFPVAFSDLHYKLELGLNGSSSVQVLRFDQLVDSETLVLYDSDLDNPTIYFRVPPDSDLKYQLFNAWGKSIVDGIIKNSNKINMNNVLSVGGVYVYSVQWEGRTFTGRLGFIQ